MLKAMEASINQSGNGTKIIKMSNKTPKTSKISLMGGMAKALFPAGAAIIMGVGGSFWGRGVLIVLDRQ
jgi:hypothetical protein